MIHEPRWLVMDVGNSAIKCGLFPPPDATLGDERSRQLPRGTPAIFRLDRQQPDWPALAEWLPAGLERACLISVCGPLADAFHGWWQQRSSGVALERLVNADFPIPNRVDHPERVGVDRLAAATAAGCLVAPGEAAIVVDAGSAITVDVVDEQGAFRGGAILPGRRLMANALFQGTDQLPNLAPPSSVAEPSVVGTSTEKAIRSGIDWGVVGAVRELVARMTARFTHAPRLFLTGGDAEWLERQLQLPAIGDPYLVLRGLHHAAARRPAKAQDVARADQGPPAAAHDGRDATDGTRG